MKTSHDRSALLGAVCWLMTALALRPSPLHLRWGILLLLLAPLVLVPLAMSRTELVFGVGIEARLHRLASALQFPAAPLLAISFAFPEGKWAGMLALPWLATTALISATGILNAYQARMKQPPEDLSVNAGKAFLVVGGVWVVLSRLGMRPLGFDPVIVLLTGIHFHYAGYLLPLMTGWAGKLRPTSLSRLASIGVIVGVPMTALGITLTQLKIGAAPELAAALLTAAAGGLTATLHFKLAVDRSFPKATRICWAIAAASLSIGVVFAAMYGTRSLLPMAWLEIPLMRAIHGTANGLGFGLFGVLGWVSFTAGGAEPLRFFRSDQRSPSPNLR